MFESGRYVPDPADPLQDPASRWLRCQYLVEHGREPFPALDDALTLDAWRFLRDMRQCLDDAERQRLAQRHPSVAAAYQLFTQVGPLQRAEMEARVLAGENDEIIALKCRCTPAVIAAYHDLFFAVRPHLQAEVYILNLAIGPKVHDGLTSADHEILLKLVGYRMGGRMVDQLLDYFTDPPDNTVRLTALDSAGLEKLHGKLLVQAMILSMTMPADAVTAARLPAVRTLLAQAGVLAKGSGGAENTPLSAVPAALDYRAFLSEPEAGAFHAATPASTDVASSIGEWVGSAMPCPREWQAMPA
jgi:hypothetical protein